MRESFVLRVSLATGIAILLVAAFLGILSAAPAAPDGISFDLEPVPPRSIVPGTVETFTWGITGGTPDHVEFEVKNPLGVIVDAHTYPGSSGLAVTRHYTPTMGAQLGLYWSEVRYFRMEGGMLTAGGSFCVSDRGNLHVYKFDDFNGNGVQDVGEGPVAGVTMAIAAVPGSLCPSDPARQLTAVTGWARWDGIAVGTYVVSETVPPGREPTLPISRTVEVRIGETTVVTFANRLPPTPTPTPTSTATPSPTPTNGCIIGKKIDDLHVGLPGWTIHARPRDAQAPILTALTDGGGDFYFAGLSGGWWTVWEEGQPGWAPVTPDMFDVEVPVNPPCVEVRFKNRQACAQDPYELDDTWSTATWLLPNAGPQKHTLEPPTDLDWVKFDARAGASYTLQTDDLLGSTDTLLTLYDTDGTTLLAANDDIVTGADPRSRIVWIAPANGTYFARVRDYYQAGARGCLGYELILAATYRNYLPLIIAPPPPPPPTPTLTNTPTATATRPPTLTPTPTPTRTPIPTLPPITIQGLSHPKGIGVNLRTHRLYVASRDTHVIYEVDPLIGTVVRAIPVGHEPFGVTVNSATNKIYVANYLTDNLSVINGTTGTVLKTIAFAPYGEPTYVAINENTNRVYVALHDGGRVAVINGATDTLVSTLEVGGGAFGVTVDPLLNRVYVSCRDAKVVRVVDGATNTILWGQTIYPVGTPYALGIDPGLNRLYVSFSPEADNPRQVLVYRIPDTGPSLLTAVLVGHGGADGGGGIAANPLTHHVFVSNSAADTVTVFDGVTHMLLDTVPVGDDPMAVAIDPGLSYAFVGNRASNSVSGIPDGY